MSRPKMTEAHRQQIRGQILDRAYAILIEKGAEHISSRAIAQHLDLTHMGLFTYFPNQAAILQALAEREQAKILEQLQPLVKRAEIEDITLVMEEALHNFQQFARQNANLFRLIWIEPQPASPPLWMQSTIDLIARLIAAGKEKGTFSTADANISAALVIAQVNMPFILANNGKISSPEMVENLSREALAAAMAYLQIGIEPGGKFKPEAWERINTWLRQIRLRLGKILTSDQEKSAHGMKAR